MTFKLSKRSLAALEGVDERLVAVVKRAIELTKVDFIVIEGLRSLERQRELFARNATQTMQSKHLIGKAVDLMAYVGTRASWELALYDEIADAMRLAAIEHNVPVRWGAAWDVPDIRAWMGPMEAAMNHYVDGRRKQKLRAFIDAPHFEIM